MEVPGPDTESGHLKKASQKMTLKKQGDFAITRDSVYGTTNEPTYAGITSFMRRRYTQDLDGVDLVVTGVPLDTATTNRPGARSGRGPFGLHLR